MGISQSKYISSLPLTPLWPKHPSGQDGGQSLQLMLGAPLVTHPSLGRSSVLVLEATTCSHGQHSGPGSALKGRKLPCGHTRTHAMPTVKGELRIHPYEWKNPSPHSALWDLMQTASQLLWGCGQSSISNCWLVGFFQKLIWSPGFSLLPCQWRLAHFHASGLHLFRKDICERAQASGKIIAVCPVHACRAVLQKHRKS